MNHRSSNPFKILNNSSEENSSIESCDDHTDKHESSLLNANEDYHTLSRDNNFNTFYRFENENKHKNNHQEVKTSSPIEISSFFTKNKTNYNNSYCVNCGKKGHTSKKCNLPIMSIGIICINLTGLNINLNDILCYSKKLQNNYLFEQDELRDMKDIYDKVNRCTREELSKKINYLMIRRKHSLSYVDFIRGKYDMDDYEHIHNTIYLMTNIEQHNLMNNKFEDLWLDLWSTNYNMNYSQEYEESKTKFEKLKSGCIIHKNDIMFNVNFQSIIEQKNRVNTEPEWGFPKGRRDINESNIDCAKREFREETGIHENDYFILNMSPLEETYLGSNHIRYKHIYYFAQTPKYTVIDVDQNNEHQKIEIGDIKWLTFEEGYSRIREYHIEKKNVLNNTNNFIINMILNYTNLFNNYNKFI